MKNRKLLCSCKESIFEGIACRHEICVFIKQSRDILELHIQKRWEKNYFNVAQLPVAAVQNVSMSQDIATNPADAIRPTRSLSQTTNLDTNVSGSSNSVRMRASSAAPVNFISLLFILNSHSKNFEIQCTELEEVGPKDQQTTMCFQRKSPLPSQKRRSKHPKLRRRRP